MCPMSVNLSKCSYPQVRNAKIVGNIHDYLINKGSIGVRQRGYRSENINSCTAGVLSNNTKHFMFHASPEAQPLIMINEELAKQIQTLRQTCDDVKGFICGGWALDNKDGATVQSFDLYNTIADALDSLGVKFMMICGKEKNSPMDNIYAVNNNITMWNDRFKQLFQKENMSSEDIVEALEREYQFVENEAGYNLNVIK